MYLFIFNKVTVTSCTIVGDKPPRSRPACWSQIVFLCFLQCGFECQMVHYNKVVLEHPSNSNTLAPFHRFSTCLLCFVVVADARQQRVLVLNSYFLKKQFCCVLQAEEDTRKMRSPARTSAPLLLQSAQAAAYAGWRLEVQWQDLSTPAPPSFSLVVWYRVITPGAIRANFAGQLHAVL